MVEKFNIVKKGYDIDEVNKCVEELLAVVSSYKEKDASIKNAILSAQIAADNIVGTAKNEAEDIVKKAEEEAVKIRTVAIDFLDGAVEAVSECKGRIISFQREYDAMIRRYAENFSESEVGRLISDADEIEASITGFRKSIDKKL